jgi:carboxyl-terminal processing protease
MFAACVRFWAFLVPFFWVFPLSGSDSADGVEQTLVDGDLSDFARRAFQITELVLDQHFEPPTRQEMLLCGLLAVHADHARQGLSRAASEVTSEDEFVDCLLRHWPTSSNHAESASLRRAFLHGLASATPGGIYFRPAKEALVERQLAANQYVGIGISLGGAGHIARHRIIATFPRGPAAKAGIKADDDLVAIDGASVRELSLVQVIDRLRGPEGTTVTLGIVGDAGGEPRTVTLTRSVVPRQTVVGYRELEPEKWDPLVPGEDSVGYLRIREIGGSTVAELRQYEAELFAVQADSLILDLRTAHGSELRHAIAIADSLLDGGSAAGIRSRDGSRSAPLDRDCLFRDWPMAVLVTENTDGLAEWLAGLLQERRGGIVVGRSTKGARRYVYSSVELPHDWGVMTIATVVLDRETMTGRRRAAPLPLAVGAGASAGGIIRSHLSRLHPKTQESSDALFAVTPSISVEPSSSESSEFQPQQSDGVRSPFVTSAVKALARLSGNASDKTRAAMRRDP